MNKVIFSHKCDEWRTPRELFNTLNDLFHFDVDAAATEENKLCDRYFVDGLAANWDGLCVYCNPPYSNIKAWVEKAYNAKAKTIMLLPARTDTIWFHKYIYGKHTILFLRGRLKFNDGKGAAPFPSMLVLINNMEVDNCIK